MVQSSIHIEDEVIETLMQEIQAEIDGEIIRNTLVLNGWVQIEFRFKSNKQAVDIAEWCETNFKKNEWNRYGSYYVFRSKKDAEWFSLRWL